MNSILMVAVALASGLGYASICEWTLHRYVMHRPLWRLVYPFKAHTLSHHRIFKADQTYHLQKAEHKSHITMDWWNGPVIVVIGCSLPVAIVLSSGGLGWWWVCGIFGTVCVLYFGAYEYLHWCMHLPLARRRVVEQLPFFRRLNGHHLLHHRYLRKNFNVVCPLADWCLGTLLRRSPVAFKQARGPSVPDVQPEVFGVPQRTLSGAADGVEAEVSPCAGLLKSQGTRLGHEATRSK